MDLKVAGVGVHELIVALSKPLWQNACTQMRNIHYSTSNLYLLMPSFFLYRFGMSATARTIWALCYWGGLIILLRTNF